MTDFLSWWADHWPLVPILVLYPIWAWEVAVWWDKQMAKLKPRWGP